MTLNQLKTNELPPSIGVLGASAAPLMRTMENFPEYQWHEPTSPDRPQVEEFIRQVFRQQYGAEVSTFAPLLLSMICKGQLSAALGIRPAVNGALFIEQYLDAPIEQLIQSPDGSPVRREEIVEISNLVSMRRGASQLLFIVMGNLLHRAGFRWLVFSATEKVERLVMRLPFPMQLLATSDPAKLGDKAAQWGSYYQTHPKVMAGDLKIAHERVEGKSPLDYLLGLQGDLMQTLADAMPQLSSN